MDLPTSDSVHRDVNTGSPQAPDTESDQRQETTDFETEQTSVQQDVNTGSPHAPDSESNQRQESTDIETKQNKETTSINIEPDTLGANQGNPSK